MNKKLTLKFHKSIYPKSVILRAMSDYSQICRVDYKEDADAFICTFSKSKANLELTAYEFGNYLIELSNLRNLEI